MNKTDLVNAIAEKANLTKVDAKNALDACLKLLPAHWKTMTK